MQILRRVARDGKQEGARPRKRRGRRIREAQERARRASASATPWLYQGAALADDVFRYAIGPESRWTSVDPRDLDLGSESIDVDCPSPEEVAQ